MVRKSGNKVFERSQQKIPKLITKFIFIHPSYTLRNTELSATIGINQLINSIKIIKSENQNLNTFKKI